MRKGACLSLALILIGVALSFPGPAEAESRVVILHSGGAAGRLFPCAVCGNKALGGLARRAAFSATARKTENALLADSGRFCPNPSAAADPGTAKIKSEQVCRAYRRMGMSAVNVSDWDIGQGLAFLEKERGKGLPLISANLTDLAGKRIFPDYIVKRSGKVRIGFFGLLRPDKGSSILIKEMVAVKDPVTAARETVSRLQRKADIIILLSDMGMEMDKNIASQVSGINFILSGRDGLYGHSAVQNGAFLLESPPEGGYVGRLRLTLWDASSGFQDLSDREIVRQQVRDMDVNIRSFEKSKRNTDSDRVLARMRQQRDALKEKLIRYESGPGDSNSFSWTIIPMDSSLPEDRTVSDWLREAGLEKD